MAQLGLASSRGFQVSAAPSEVHWRLPGSLGVYFSLCTCRSALCHPICGTIPSLYLFAVRFKLAPAARVLQQYRLVSRAPAVAWLPCAAAWPPIFSCSCGRLAVSLFLFLFLFSSFFSFPLAFSFDYVEVSARPARDCETSE